MMRRLSVHEVQNRRHRVKRVVRAPFDATQTCSIRVVSLCRPQRDRTTLLRQRASLSLAASAAFFIIYKRTPPALLCLRCQHPRPTRKVA